MGVIGFGATLLAAVVSCFPEVRVGGDIGRRFDEMAASRLMTEDIRYLTDVFFDRTETEKWQSEFWGKFMLWAVPLAEYTKNAAWRVKIAEGVERVKSAQLADGYIGNYGEAFRCASGWDVWGVKYTILGLVSDYELTGDQTSVESAERLLDYLVRRLKERGTKMRETGSYRGLASLSTLNAVLRLYGASRKQRHLDIARAIVKEMDEQGGVELVRRAGKVPLFRRTHWGDTQTNATKAYEMMSCYQGLAEFAMLTDDESLKNAIVAVADDIITQEINIVGGAASFEHWFRGADKQHLPYARTQETCVTTTWLRLLELLLEMTGDPRYADEMERTFHNAYLAAQKPREGAFCGYIPLAGSRSEGQHHCFMTTDCCNENGPRGYFALFRTLLQSDGESVIVNHYLTSRAAVAYGTSGEKVELQTYTLYPEEDIVKIWNRTRGVNRFVLKLRVPGWSRNTSVHVNGKQVDSVALPGTYVALERDWKDGDLIELRFDMTPRAHVKNGHLAITLGPLVAARDSRFSDGPLDEVYRGGLVKDGDPMPLTVVRSDDPSMRIVWSAVLPMGSHSENPRMRRPSSVRFCDFASAGSTWRPDCFYRIWMPIERRPFDEGEDTL